MELTAQEIIGLLPIVADREWGQRDALRDPDGRCPICALVHEITNGESDWKLFAEEAMAEIGLYGREAIESVMKGADYRWHPMRPVVLRALGLAA